MTALLEISRLTAGYGAVGVLEDIDLVVPEGAIVALVGSNGAGKSTLLRTISGLIKPASGVIRFAGRDIASARPDRIVAAGLLHVAEGRRLFRTQSVADNLELGLYGSGLDRAEARRRHELAFELFPILKERLGETAGVLSGGQQQMLAIAQAMMRQPRLLMMDEPSLGLAPVIVDQVLVVIQRLRRNGTTILLVEQMVERALEIADEGYVLQNGRMIGHGTAQALGSGDLIRRAYLGAGIDGGKGAAES
jgi:branched-chain amino acid transport system ATP-binding protein